MDDLAAAVLPDRLVEAEWREWPHQQRTDLDAGIAKLAEWENGLWLLWWPENQLTTSRYRPFRWWHEPGTVLVGIFHHFQQDV